MPPAYSCKGTSARLFAVGKAALVGSTGWPRSVHETKHEVVIFGRRRVDVYSDGSKESCQCLVVPDLRLVLIARANLVLETVERAQDGGRRHECHEVDSIRVSHLRQGRRSFSDDSG